MDLAERLDFGSWGVEKLVILPNVFLYQGIKSVCDLFVSFLQWSNVFGGFLFFIIWMFI